MCLWRADTDWNIEGQRGHVVLPGREEAGEVGDGVAAMFLAPAPRLVIFDSLARVPGAALDVRVGRLAREAVCAREEFRRCDGLACGV